MDDTSESAVQWRQVLEHNTSVVHPRSRCRSYLLAGVEVRVHRQNLHGIDEGLTHQLDGQSKNRVGTQHLTLQERFTEFGSGLDPPGFELGTQRFKTWEEIEATVGIVDMDTRAS